MPPPASSQESGPPDGGWGWAVVVGAFVSIGFSYAFPKAITVFFKEIQEIFDTSYSQIAWISSTTLAVMYAGGPLSSILVNKYGSRPVMMFGGLLCSIGMIAASFCNSILGLFMCVGCIGGWLVDITHDYKYMYLVCGSIVIIASIFLFIANAINYRLLEKEKKMEEEKRKTPIDDAELNDICDNGTDDIEINPQMLLGMSSEKETNI
ncbi:hypothetical protein chiPu_0014387 [Chiloscyllium punctatum]|uniref:Uncharacterized protein n=1 Tax=Chiloscyllium punctatum TaxID=137246 RepID=A0A401SZU6_CHIPU|nr:hypothetical protein [Chiloscyllium punctatum]